MVSQLKLEGVGMTSKRTRDRLVQRLSEQGIVDFKVLSIIANTPRHLFVDEALSHRAYEDTALPIGFKQTLSQPYIVARMTELLLSHAPEPQNVLEIGTGSGYQTTILAQVSENVFSVERINALLYKARQRLRQLKLHNVSLKHGDGGEGWPEKAPFDGIVATAAPEVLPQELLAQLSPDGVLIAPVGGGDQYLQIIKRVGDSEDFERRALEPVCFVPLLPGVV